jgi:hypothetical protein
MSHTKRPAAAAGRFYLAATNGSGYAGKCLDTLVAELLGKQKPQRLPGLCLRSHGAV